MRDIMQGKWERQTHQYSCGENYRIGKIVVGSAFYEGGSKGEVGRYALRIDLPNIRNPADRYTNIEDAKARLERAVASWFRWLEETL